MPSRASLLLLALLMDPLTASAEDRLWAFRFDASMRAAPGGSWAAGGRLLGPVQALPGGEFLALVAGAQGPELRRWGAGGEAGARHRLELSGEVRAARPTAAGALVVVTSAELLRVRLADGKVLARRRHGLDLTGGRVAAAAEGAWVALPERLVFLGFDGADVVKPLPLAAGVAPPKPFVGLPPDDLVVDDAGNCLLPERRFTSHPVHGRPHDPDRTSELLLSLLSPRGELLAQRALGEVRTRWEWFWKEHGNNDLGISDVGLVRRRYDGGVSLAGGTARPDGDLVLLLGDEGGGRMVRLDHALAERWSRPFRQELPGTLSPAWTRGLLVHTGASLVFAYDEQGGSERTGSMSYSRGDAPQEALRGVALGQSPAGEWIVIEY